jgi:peptide/nickel transport system substrate-binding protein
VILDCGARVVRARRASAGGVLALLALSAALRPPPAAALELRETPMFSQAVAAGKLPPVGERLPGAPMVVGYTPRTGQPGKPGGTLRMLIGRTRDVRLLVVYGYARLVRYDRDLKLVPDILQSYSVTDGGRVFTFKLRPGMKWSDGRPFTAEDFRFWWEDDANNRQLSPAGPPREMLVNGEPPKFEVIDPATVRYSWSRPNPDFLAALAGASPLFIYEPAHYLKKYHIKYSRKVAEAEKRHTARRSWAAVFNKKNDMYKFDNPDLPTLQPWMITNRAPTDRFVAVRNPYYFRVDENGYQLPYIDRVVMDVAESKLIPAKTGAGESDLQARYLVFNDYTFLKKNELRNHYHTYLWRSGTGSQVALYPNLNVNDPAWRKVLRDVRFRRALSLAIDRSLINQVLYFGLALEGNDTVLPDSPLFEPIYQTRWANYDPEEASRLLDEMGLKRGSGGTRLLPDGRPLDITVETAGESTEQTDVLELIRETWRRVGIRLFVKPTQREVFRNRIFAGQTEMSVWTGFDNGIPTADMSPEELAPTSQQGLEWPKFGQYYETSGKLGERPDIPAAEELLQLYHDWRQTIDTADRARIWHRMLGIFADQQFVIGTVSGVPQPVVVRDTLMNVPEKGLYNWNPGAFFGLYSPDTFWIK